MRSPDRKQEKGKQSCCRYDRLGRWSGLVVRTIGLPAGCFRSRLKIVQLNAYDGETDLQGEDTKYNFHPKQSIYTVGNLPQGQKLQSTRWSSGLRRSF